MVANPVPPPHWNLFEKNSTASSRPGSADRGSRDVTAPRSRCHLHRGHVRRRPRGERIAGADASTAGLRAMSPQRTACASAPRPRDEPWRPSPTLAALNPGVQSVEVDGGDVGYQLVAERRLEVASDDHPVGGDRRRAAAQDSRWSSQRSSTAPNRTSPRAATPPSATSVSALASAHLLSLLRSVSR